MNDESLSLDELMDSLHKELAGENDDDFFDEEDLLDDERLLKKERKSSSPLLSEIASLRSELSALREELNLRQKADEVNRRNASRSAGRAGNNPAPEYYTPDEVRAMSPKEVRENYQKIRASMQKWH